MKEKNRKSATKKWTGRNIYLSSLMTILSLSLWLHVTNKKDSMHASTIMKRLLMYFTGHGFMD